MTPDPRTNGARAPETQVPGPKVKPTLRVVLANPRGFCAGVRRAIDAVLDALAHYGPPVYVRRPIVHNLRVVRELEAQGAIFVEELAEVPEGSVVILSAHGVAPAIAAEAAARRLIAFDAVCPLVAKVHREVERYWRSGRAVIVVGHAGHPEIDGTLGHVPEGRAWVVSSVGEVAGLPISGDEPAAYAVQTTYSVDDAAAIVAALRAKFSDLAEPSSSDICYATTNRQSAVRALARDVAAVIVVGERFSSNACRLAEVAAAGGCQTVQLVADAADIDWTQMPTAGGIGVTAAASTPESSVRDVLDALRERFDVAVEELGSGDERTEFRQLAIA